MEPRSALEEFLASEVAEGVKDSSGQFSLTREKALEKLAAFQLPGEHSWVLKVVQSAVAADCTALHIGQTTTDSEFTFFGGPGWKIEQVEAEFYDPQTSPDRSLQHLKQGLWSVSVHRERPFHLTAPGWSQALVWNGLQLTRQPVRSLSQHMVLTVSHRVYRAGQGLPLLRHIESARSNAAVLSELTRSAFPCPIVLRVDSRRLDALQLCPSHGLNPSSYPLLMGFLPGILPPLRLPQGTLGDYTRPSDVHSSLSTLCDVPAELPAGSAVMALLSAHAKQVSQGKSKVWRVYEHACWMYWVLDGVVIDRRAFGLPDRCCSLALFASAEGLTTDLSGFNLQVNEDYRARLEQVCRQAGPFLEGARVNLDSAIQKATVKERWLGGAMVLGGLGAAFFSPFHGVALTVGGVATFVFGGKEEKTIAAKVEMALRDLQFDWPPA